MYLRFYFRGTGRNKLTVETFARIFYRNKPFASGKSLRGDTKHRKRFDPRPTLSVNVKWRSHTLDNLLPSPSLTPTAVSSPPLLRLPLLPLSSAHSFSRSLYPLPSLSPGHWAIYKLITGTYASHLSRGAAGSGSSSRSFFLDLERDLLD